MKPIYLITGLLIFIFGIMEIYRDYSSTIGFILLMAGLIILSMQFFSWRSEQLDEYDDSDNYFDASDGGGD